jgi:RimJ/RimL family protein N-acetyltransferase
MITPVTLQGLSVCLVPLTLAHLDRLCAIGLDARLWQSTTIQISSREQMEAYVCAALESQKTGTALPFVVVERSTGEVVGMTRYHSAVPEQKRVEIGFSWVSPTWQRTVVNTESKYLLLHHACEILDCVRVEFKANVENEKSLRALVRIGAKQEGVLRCYRVTPSGVTYDLALFSIIASEWPQVRSRLESMLGMSAKASEEPNKRMQDDHSRATLLRGA